MNWKNNFETFDDPFCLTILAYAAGDAFGAYYEFTDSKIEISDELKAKSNWPIGGVSDDTLLSLLTIKAMEDSDPGKRYLDLLKENLNSLRGLGPTTRSVLGLKVKPNERGEIGNTNGGMMRSALCGLGNFPENKIENVVASTHSHKDAINFSIKLVRLFRGATIPNVPIPVGEIGLSPEETFNAICHVVTNSNSVLEAYKNSCAMGGDTDTVAAISGSLFVARNGADSLLEIPWLQEVDWCEISKDVDMAVKVLRRNS